MGWSIEYDPRALIDLRKLDQTIQREILDYMDNRINTAENPRNFGKPLRGSKYGLWRYRVRDYRIVCELQDKRLAVLAVATKTLEQRRDGTEARGSGKAPWKEAQHILFCRPDPGVNAWARENQSAQARNRPTVN